MSAIFLGALTVYLLLPTRMYYWDGVIFAMDIERAHGPGDPLFHRHHLVYKIVGNWIYRLLQWVHHPVRALFVLQTANAFLAAVSAAVVFLILRRMALSTTASAALALLFAFAATWWRFATNADPYVGSVFFLLLSYAVLRVRSPTRGARLVLAALLHAAAMLLHQLAVWFFPAALTILWMQTAESHPAKLRRMTVYVVLAGTPVAALYRLAYRTLRPAGSFAQWISGHSPDSHFTFGVGRDFFYTMRGNLRLFFGGKLDALQGDWRQLAGLIGLAFVAGFLATRRAVIRRWLGAAIPGAGARLRAEVPLLVWLTSYLVFLFVWQPEHEFYRLFYWPAIILLIGAALAGREPRSPALLASCVAFVALWNLVFLIVPQSKVEANQPLRFGLQAHGQWPAGTLIVFRKFVPDLWTIAYFNMQASWRSSSCADPMEMEGYRRRMRAERHGFWLDNACYERLRSTGPGAGWLAAHSVFRLASWDRHGRPAGCFYQVR